MKVRVHPLFFLSLFAYTLLGGLRGYLFSFLAVMTHEFSHALVAHLTGANSLIVTLTPYGAMMTAKGEIPRFGAVLVAGPLSNLLVASLLLSACWILPELYGGIKGLIRANVMIASVNLLPAYPLDGGRLCRVLFRGEWARKFTSLFTLAVALAAGVGAGVTWNLSLALFASFMLSYFLAFCLKRRTRCDSSSPLYALAKTDEEGRLLSALVRRKSGKKRRLSPREITALCLSYPRETEIEEALLEEEKGPGYK